MVLVVLAAGAADAGAGGGGLAAGVAAGSGCVGSSTSAGYPDSAHLNHRPKARSCRSVGEEFVEHRAEFGPGQVREVGQARSPRRPGPHHSRYRRPLGRPALPEGEQKGARGECEERLDDR